MEEQTYPWVRLLDGRIVEGPFWLRDEIMHSVQRNPAMDFGGRKTSESWSTKVAKVPYLIRPDKTIVMLHAVAVLGQGPCPTALEELADVG